MKVAFASKSESNVLSDIENGCICLNDLAVKSSIFKELSIKPASAYRSHKKLKDFSNCFFLS